MARLLGEEIIPATAAPDAVHLALSAVHGMDYVLTWNCKHIHNVKLERRIEARAAPSVLPARLFAHPLRFPRAQTPFGHALAGETLFRGGGGGCGC